MVGIRVLSQGCCPQRVAIAAGLDKNADADVDDPLVQDGTWTFRVFHRIPPSPPCYVNGGLPVIGEPFRGADAGHLYRGITFILYLRIKAFLGQKPRAGDEIIE
jgi:hypothetical protein